MMKQCPRCKKERYWYRDRGIAMLRHEESGDYLCDDGIMPVSFDKYVDPNQEMEQKEA